jgi:uncharacterized protein with PIN domain
MLIRLGRWLRAAGYDTAIATARGADRALLDDARRQGRTLITRDRKMLEIRNARACTLVLAGNGLGKWVVEVTEGLGIDWLKAPFSRCLLCNGILDVAAEDVRVRLPERVKEFAARATWCRNCDKLYWPGGHVQRMRHRLEAWHRNEYA